MSAPISVLFEDETQSSYRFKPLVDFDQWYEVPRVGECILDGNEMVYMVMQVVWYGPQSARVRIRREQP